ncbi:MAG TPA: D-alanyl-D-alanine carboxypeptidase family protein [Solirubrobacteraceae bacterium]|nr:D-alanyl-D-alanine carboxypeptidase family protein [Solirubrobacteraceae bacterium]
MIRLLPLLLAVIAMTVAPTSALAQARPDIDAPSAIVIEASTGEVAYAKDPSAKRSIASTTKLMTALLTLESVALDDVLTVAPYTPSGPESLGGLRAGERMTARDLLRALMLASANDAAVTLATRISGSVPAFVREMNTRAKQLGLKDTRYTNPIGLDTGGRSSARDLVKLAQVLRRNEFFRRTVDLPRVRVTSGAQPRTYLNRNTLVRRVPWVNGVKTGHTSLAGYVLVGSATRNGVTVISAVLGTPSEAARDAESLELLRYGLSRYRRTTLVKNGQALARVDLKYRDEQVRLVAGSGVQRVLRRDRRARLRVSGVPKELDGPLTAGARQGRVDVLVGGKVVASAPLVTATAVEEAGLSTRLAHVAGQGRTVLLAIVLVVCTVLLVLLRRRVVGRTGSRA